jgi:hypothetical protein
MKKHRVILSTVLLVLFVGVQTQQFAQDTSTGPANADQARRRDALGPMHINPVVVLDEENRLQPRRDVNAGNGLAAVFGPRPRMPAAGRNSHNFVHSAAGAALLNAEPLRGGGFHAILQ